MLIIKFIFAKFLSVYVFIMNNNEKTDVLNLMVISTSLRENYNTIAMTNPKLIDHFDVNTNPMCQKMKGLYAEISDESAQCISMSMMIYLLILINNGFSDDFVEDLD